MRTRRPNKPLRVIHSIEELPVVCDCAEAGLLLRVYPETVVKMARDKILPGVKVGQSWRFRRDDLVDYLDKLFGKGG
ncbi:MAG: helix-turn-helix domain-containing protein [Dysosmobacter sp.]|nr:helix-turn-helix domain-containing protein [Dysosmobacter sp.]